MRKKRPSRHSTGRLPKRVAASEPPPPSGPIDRRTFMGTASGILLAASGLNACAGTDPSQLGTIIVTITGLGAGLVDGGTAVIERTDIATQLPLNITVPVSGAGQADVPAGTYHAVYTPPVGYQVVGSNVFDVTIEPFKTTTLDVAVTFIVVATQGTLRVTVTGLTASAPNGGSASMQISGQSAIVAPVPLTGSVDTVVTAGTYQVTYTPPVGWALVGGTQNPKTIAVAVGATGTVTFPVAVIAAGFPTPDILNNASFDAGFAGFTNGGLAAPSSGGQGGFISRDNTTAFDGTTSVKRILPNMTNSTGDDSPQFFYWRPGGTPLALDRWWSRFYVRMDGPMSGGAILKLQLHFSDGFGVDHCGFYIHTGNLRWFFAEDLASGTTAASIIAPQTAIADGNWHMLEVDHFRNGDKSFDGVNDYPSAAIWLDGNLVIPADTSINKHANGRIYAVTTRAYPTTQKLGVWAAHGVLNDKSNTVARNMWIDRVAISTLGRIGP